MNKPSLAIVAFLILSLSLVSLHAFQNASAQSTDLILINGDGAISGTDLIQRNGDLYVASGDINTPVVVERNNIVIDGSGFELRGTQGWDPNVAGSGATPALNLTAANVTVQNFNIMNWRTGILGAWDDNQIVHNNITSCENGISLYGSHYEVAYNLIAGCTRAARVKAFKNNFTSNHIANNQEAFLIYSSWGIIITGNAIEKNGIVFNSGYTGYLVYHNNFVDNIVPLHATSFSILGDVGAALFYWDHDNEGNYWINYNGADADGDGIGDTPYMVRETGPVIDRYPLAKPVVIQNATLPSSSPIQTLSPTPSIPEFPAWLILPIALCTALTLIYAKRKWN